MRKRKDRIAAWTITQLIKTQYVCKIIDAVLGSLKFQQINSMKKKEKEKT